jgi:sugar phosphate isomerase/epimerase
MKEEITWISGEEPGGSGENGESLDPAVGAPPVKKRGASMPQTSISTWSLHRGLGPIYKPAADGSGRLEPNGGYGSGEWPLLEVPAQLAERGIEWLEICHFHFPSIDAGYIAELRRALDFAGVKLHSVLIDAGDITHPEAARREADLNWIKSWISVAARCGAKRVRVIAGDAQPDAEGRAVRLSAAGLSQLSHYARERGLQVITENWHALTMDPKSLVALLDRLEGEVGLCVDFGNYSGPEKYAKLEKIMPHADSIHAKAHFPEAGRMDRDDFSRCLDLSKTAGFAGPYTMIFDGPGDEWTSLGMIQEEIRSYL